MNLSTQKKFQGFKWGKKQMDKQADYDAMAGEIVKYNKPLKRPLMDIIKQKFGQNFEITTTSDLGLK